METAVAKIGVQRYEAYKPIEEAWIEEIPAHWEIRKLKHLFFEKKHKPNPELSCGSISYGKVIFKDDEKIPLSTKASYQEVLAGEFLINPLNLNYDLVSLRIGLSYIDVVVSPGYIVLKAAVKLDKGYYKYLLHRYDVAYMKLLGSGVRQTISFTHIANSLLPYPPLEEQTAIANFLDRKTAQIDQAIAQKERLIELLQERRQLLIQRAVTRGLNLEVPMKNSGVDWIGEVPTHWDVKALKYICKLQSGETIKPDDFIEDGYPVFGGNGFRGYTSKWTNEGIFALIGRQGALCGNVNYASGKFYASEHAIVAYPTNNESVTWLGEAIRASDLNRFSQSAAQPGIAVNVIKEILFPYPPRHEQESISSFITHLEKKGQGSIEKLELQLDKLREYKSTLINAAVTGKIKVC